MFVDSLVDLFLSIEISNLFSFDDLFLILGLCGGTGLSDDFYLRSLWYDLSVKYLLSYSFLHELIFLPELFLGDSLVIKLSFYNNNDILKLDNK
jgi:hypothetical protein